MKKSKFDEIYLDRKSFYTYDFGDGKSVYGEKLIRMKGKTYRFWDSYRSKFSAALSKGLETHLLKRDSNILYLGAANGTTVSHFSDIVRNGKVYAIEFSSRSFRDLLLLSKSRSNIHPLLEDANHPERFALFIEGLDVIYQDVAQRNQTDIFIKNMNFFNVKQGLIMIKTQCIDVTKKPSKVMDEEINKIVENGFGIDEILNLGKLEKDHYAVVVHGN